MKALTALVAAVLAASPGAALAMSTPALLDPAAIAGTWSLTSGEGVTCRITLRADQAVGTGGFALELGDCAAVPALAAVTNWRASSDGVALAQADRSTVVFLAKQGDDLFSARGPNGRWTMTPAE